MSTLQIVEMELKKAIQDYNKTKEILESKQIRVNQLREEEIFLKQGFKVGYVIRDRQGVVGLVTQLTSLTSKYDETKWRKISKATGKLHKCSTYFSNFPSLGNRYEVLAPSYEAYIAQEYPDKFEELLKEYKGE